MILGQMMMVGVRFCKHHYLGGGRLMLNFFFQDWFGFRPIAKGFHIPVAVLLVGIIARFCPNFSPFLFPISYAFSAAIPIHQAYRAWGSRQVSVYLRPERTWYLVTNPAPSSLSVCSSIIRLISHPRLSRCTG